MLDSNPATIAARLRIAQEERGLSNIELAEIMDVSPQAITYWRRTGNIRRDRVPKLAATLQRTSEWLLYGVQRGSESQVGEQTPDYGLSAANRLRRARRPLRDLAAALGVDVVEVDEHKLGLSIEFVVDAKRALGITLPTATVARLIIHIYRELLQDAPVTHEAVLELVRSA